jgi:hypothetical protein
MFHNDNNRKTKMQAEKYLPKSAKYLTLFSPNPDEPEPKRKKLLYPDFTTRPDQKSNALNPGDSANPNTTKKALLFLQRYHL